MILNVKFIKDYKFIFSLLLISILFELLIHKLFYLIYQNNKPSNNLYIITTVFFYQLIFVRELKGNFNLKILLPGIFIWSFFSLIYSVFIIGIWEINSLTYTIGLFIASCIFIYYMKGIIFNRPYSNIFRNPLFWFGMSILLFFTAAFPMLYYFNSLNNKIYFSAFVKLMGIGNILLSLGYIMTVFCFWYNEKFPEMNENTFKGFLNKV